jgi:mannose-6-phosphate isomerase-like protein (cupin superfamily)
MAPQPHLTSKKLPVAAEVLAPDGSEVRLLATASRGSMAHFRLLPGAVAKAVRHRSVDEVWFIVAGTGRIWRKLDEAEDVLALEAGLSFTILPGTAFQFRNDGLEPLDIVGVTMPPWPGADEALLVDGLWTTG